MEYETVKSDSAILEFKVLFQVMYFDLINQRLFRKLFLRSRKFIFLVYVT